MREDKAPERDRVGLIWLGGPDSSIERGWTNERHQVRAGSTVEGVHYESGARFTPAHEAFQYAALSRSSTAVVPDPGDTGPSAEAGQAFAEALEHADGEEANARAAAALFSRLERVLQGTEIGGAREVMAQIKAHVAKRGRIAPASPSNQTLPAASMSRSGDRLFLQVPRQRLEMLSLSGGPIVVRHVHTRPFRYNEARIPSPQAQARERP